MRLWQWRMDACASGPRIVTLLLGGALLLGHAAAASRAEDPKADEKPAPPATKTPEGAVEQQPAAPAAEGITVPDGTPEELMQFIQRMMTTRPAGTTREQMIANYLEMQRAVVKASDKILAHKDASAEEAGDVITAATLQAKLRALSLLQQLEDPTADAAITAVIDKYSGDKRERVASLVNRYALQRRFVLPQGADAKAAMAVVDDAKKYFAENPLKPEHLAMIMNLARQIEMVGSPEQAADVYKHFGEMLEKSGSPKLVEYGKKFIGTARRVTLVGKPMEVFGKQLDGKELDWKAYKGKVVLVDFWATWCGPCLAEMPNLTRAYDDYHDRGFEVIGISIDEKKADVEDFVRDRKVPWPILFSDDPKAQGWDNPMASYYGILGVPTVILVNREGNVVSLNARGPELGRLLNELIGPRETNESKKDKPNAEKPAE